MPLQKSGFLIFYLFIIFSLLFSCAKNDIQFGTGLADSYLTVSTMDTVSVNLSTYFPDSFSTTKPSAFIIGKFKDPLLGTVTAKPFFQLTVPSGSELSGDAVYDSMVLVLKLNRNYYGDTNQVQVIEVNELDAPIDYTYSTYLFNTSSIAEKNTPLGSTTMKIRPNIDDSIVIRMSDVSGNELFRKIKQQDDDVLSQDAFLRYFQGLSVAFTGTTSSLIIGVQDTLTLRIHYHNSIPYHDANTIDMATYTNGIYFNQILADRTETPFATHLTNYPTEVSSSLTNDVSFLQGLTGTMVKISFPGIRDFLAQDTMIKMLAATLVLRAQSGTYDPAVLRLPDSLFLVGTNGANTIGSALTSDNMSSYMSPVTDYLNDVPAYYSINITTWLNDVLENTTTNDFALFALQNYPGVPEKISRAVFSNSTEKSKGSQLLITFLTIKK